MGKIRMLLMKTPKGLRWCSAGYLLLTLCMLVFLDKGITYACKNTLNIGNLVLVALLLPFGIGCCFLYGSFKKDRERKLAVAQVGVMPGLSRFLRKHRFGLALLAFTVLLFLLQLFVSSRIWFKTGWDVEVITYTAEKLAQGGTLETTGFEAYLQRYPNNVMIVFIFKLLIRFFAWLGIDAYAGLIIGSCLNVSLSVLLAACVIKKITGSCSAGYAGFVVLSVLIGLSPWIIIPYTDTYVMLYPILAVFILVYCENRYLSYFLFTFFCFWGCLIKPTVVIVWIAFVLIKGCRLLASFCGSKQYFKKLLAVIPILAAILLNLSVFRNMARAEIGFEADRTKEFSIVHFAMMGLREEPSYGGYSSEDVEYSKEFPTYDARIEGNLALIQQRLSALGPAGLVKHLVRKNLASYNDGTFAWAKEGTFYKALNEKEGPVAGFLKNYYYTTSDQYGTFPFVCQLIWVALLLLCVVCGLSRKNHPDSINIIFLTLFGLSMFLLLFESRARYLLPFVPLYAVPAMLGLRMLYHHMVASWSKLSNKTDKAREATSCEEGVRGQCPDRKLPGNKPTIVCRNHGSLHA